MGCHDSTRTPRPRPARDRVYRTPRGEHLQPARNQRCAVHDDSQRRQTYAQAFDAVAAALRAGGTVPPQPFFEKALSGSTLCAAPSASCTAGLVSRFRGPLQPPPVTHAWNRNHPPFHSVPPPPPPHPPPPTFPS